MKTPGRETKEKIDRIAREKVFAGRSGDLPTWCPGCGYFGIHYGILEAIRRLGIPNHQVMTVSGIGCAGRYPFFADTYGLHTVHGRALPTAFGIIMANPELMVFAVGGDGDGLGIGGGHLPHAARRDADLNYVLFDNSIYGLTKGQPSPTSPLGTKSKASPQGTQDRPLNGTLMALSYGAGFVARLFAGDPQGIASVLIQGMKHRGFSFYHVYSTCLTFDKKFKTWDNLNRWVHPLPPEHDPANRQKAMLHVMEDDFSTGIVYWKRP